MSHHDIDPSLCAAEPRPESLDDGFSPPAQAHPARRQDVGQADADEPALGPKSPF
jgi:hypothetical protein